jgi:methyl-accepting chemotaxis protein
MFSIIMDYSSKLSRNLSIKIKLTICYLIVIAVFIVFAVISYNQMTGIADEVSTLVRDSQNRNTIQSLSELSRDEYINSTNMIAGVDRGATEENYLKQVNKLSGKFREYLGQLEQEYKGTKLIEQLVAIKNLELNFKKTFEEKLIVDYKAGDVEQIHRWAVELSNNCGGIIGFSDSMNEYVQAEQKKSMEKIQTYIKQVITNILAGIIIAFLLSILVAFLSSRSIVNPLRKLIKYSNRIAEGDLTGEDIISKSNDETGQLMQTFNVMRKALRNMIQVSLSISHQVASSSQQLAASTELVGVSGKEVKKSMILIAEESVEQFDRTQIVTESVSGLLERVRMVTDQTQEMTQAVSRVVEKINDGNQSVIDAVSQMESVASQVNISSQVVEKLGKRSQEVGRIIDVIAQIAGQTKLLSLNAAIEAARAGEQGKGFAVVAEEVRKLSEQSANSSGLISHLIREIQEDTISAVKAMLSGKEETDKGNEVIKGAGEKFSDINHEIRILAGYIDQLAISADEMDNSGQKAGAYVRDIAAMTEKATAGSQQASSEMIQLLVSVEEITSAASNLASTAEELVISAAKFKI